MSAVRLSLIFAVAALFAWLAFATVAPDQAQAHRSRCHQAHTCPSDHATYRWYGRAGGRLGRWLCVHRTAEERNRTFKDPRGVRRSNVLLQALAR
jgi:hypothetical protein